MRFVIFCHSLVSDWNHGNAHFLRGLMEALQRRGHQTVAYENRDGWSLQNLLAEQGPEAISAFYRAYPTLESRFYTPPELDLDAALAGADVVLAHEWNEPAVLAALAAHRRHHRYQLYFHDTHHRAVSDPGHVDQIDLAAFDGVLAFGRVLADRYRAAGRCQRVFVWHEAADARRFRPQPEVFPEADLVWIGNWGDEERSAELREFLIDPVRELGLSARVHGVRYPPEARAALVAAGISYRGWLPNFAVPDVFARHRVTVHVPRRAYVESLPGIPTIRPFEALAAGIPLCSAPFGDCENLFEAGRDHLVVHDGQEMKRELRALLADPESARRLARAGRKRIEAAHTCDHRAGELLEIVKQVGRAATSKGGQG